MILRRTAAALGAAALLTACGAQTTVGVALRIGDDAIETASFAERVERVYRNEQFAGQQPKEEFQRQMLNRIITERLVAEAARRHGVSIPDDEVNRQIEDIVRDYGSQERFEQEIAARGFHASEVPNALRTELLRGRLMDKLVADVPVTDEQLRTQYQRQLPEYDNARIAHIVVHDRKVAAQVVKRARAGEDFARLAARFSEDPETKDNGGDLGRVGNGEGRFAKSFEKAVFSAKTGDVVGPLRVPVEGAPDVRGFEIVKVVERVTRPFATVRDDLRRAVLAEESSARFAKLMADLTRELDIEVNPRFGVWDAQRLQVAPPDGNRLSSPAPEPGAPGIGLPPGVPPAGQVPPGQGQPGQGQPGQGQPGQGQPGQGQPGQPGGQPAPTPAP